MKKIFCSAACLLLLLGMSSFMPQPTKVVKKGMVTLACSQQINGGATEKVQLAVDKNGYIKIFDGKSMKGWRGYGKNHIPSRWIVEDGCIKFNATGQGANLEGGDLIFAHKFKNFELDMEWKISKGGNSGIFYLAQEAVSKDKDGKEQLEPIYCSAPEYQVLDNVNHPDAKLGVNGDRQSASLYDMIPAKPQNQNPYEQWNYAKIVVKNGKVTHYQNGKEVLSYQLWTPEWTKLLQASKFSEKSWPSAFALLNNCGGANHEGFIGLQDHGNDVWYRNICIKVLK
ncbi:MAG: DUF1080 domain-containing protein [Bacteroidaceae bacterium]|jgi:hypothetical protein|nr:DUF1080 domain-containing protein [Bacteroidaceae bacterium]